ncbi:MAG: hypothetical protein H7Z15_07840 [Rhizobacter sp.]|nr:hypothetical protein [Rhizobacter sp.]
MTAWRLLALWAPVLGACVTAGAAEPSVRQQPTRVVFSLPQAATTSAGVYDENGRLVRTLWRGEALAPGTHQPSWDGLDDAGEPVTPGNWQVKLLHHRLSHVWEGVIGNSSFRAGQPPAHKAYLPPASIAIRRDHVYYAVGYNEQQPGIHGFHLTAPQANTRPLPSTDAFAAYSMIATDANRLYWANTGGLVRTSFVGVFDLERAQPAQFTSGKPVCLNRHPSGNCYEAHSHASVIDLQTGTTETPTGLAVQRHGRLLAVAHGAKGVIRLFDKTSGELLHEVALPLAAGALNQLAMTPGGDLWAISGRSVHRYTDLLRQPRRVATIDGLTRPLALATHPDEEGLWVADGGTSQQVKRFDAQGQLAAVIGRPGGYTNDPAVAPDRLCFKAREGREQTALAVSADHSVWVVDHCNNRMLRFRAGATQSDTQIAYLPAFYTSTVNHANPRRVFANFLEFDVATDGSISWTLVRNWLAGLPPALNDQHAFNGLFGGLRTVQTLSNGRTYGVVLAQGRQVIVELPPSGPLRVVKMLAMPLPRNTHTVMYENGDLGHAVTGASSQHAMRLRLTGFDGQGDPVWGSDPVTLASVPLLPGSPHYRGAFSGMPPRFPLTGSGKVVFFDQSVVGNEGFHLGAAALGGQDWLWQASPSGALDGKGSFQTKAIDGSTHYGGNAVWAHGRHIVFGYHGEFHKDLQTGQVGQANQFMHFDESGLFLGQFGQRSTRPAPHSQAGLSGNAFSPTLVRVGDRLHLYHNDESSHGGVHRWRIDGWDDVRELRGSGPLGGSIELR